MNQNGPISARIMPAAAAEPSPSVRNAFLSAQPTAIQPIRILIADDHAIVRDGLRMLLSNQPDFRVVGEAADGMGAIAAVRDVNPDVLLLDMMMPKMDGFGVLQELRRMNAAVRTI